MLNSDNISFRRLQTEDLRLMHKWLNEPHVHQWYDKDEQNTFERVSQDYEAKISGKEATNSYLVLYEQKPVAYIQSYKAKDWPEFAQSVGYKSSTAGIDVFIGESTFIGKGFGNLMIKKFLKEIVFADPDISICLIDPEPENKRAIKAYEKVGFTYVKTLQIPNEPYPAYLMEIKKEELKR